MSLNGLGLRQHVVEFIPGTGIVTDGVTDATSVNGPWTWVVPNGVSQILIDACGGGQGGGGGATLASMISAGGAAGGLAGGSLMQMPMAVRPNASLTITAGAAGAGEAAGSQNSAAGGGSTSIVGLLPGLSFSSVAGTLTLNGGASGQGSFPTASTTTSTTGGGGTAAGANGSGSNTGVDNQVMFDGKPWASGVMYSHGGGGAINGTTAGGNGSGCFSTNAPISQSVLTGPYGGGAGTAVGGVSRGGGGDGVPTRFGLGGVGGSNSVGANAIGYGAAGGGGAGGFAGGSGGSGYVRFTYWSAQ